MSNTAGTHGTLGWIETEQMRMAREKREKRNGLIQKERRILFPMLAASLFLLPNFGRAKVVGRSMEPTLHSGQSLVILKTHRLFSPLRVGDMVVITKKEGDLQGEDIVKRIVFIQNAEGNAPWPKTINTAHGPIVASRLFPREVLGYEKVPPHKIYVLGDNLPVSTDSRDPDVGAVDPSEVIGKVVFRK
jgi:signal peptidase I